MFCFKVLPNLILIFSSRDARTITRLSPIIIRLLKGSDTPVFRYNNCILHPHIPFRLLLQMPLELSIFLIVTDSRHRHKR